MTSKPVLLTGASGSLGAVLVEALAARGVALRLTDIAPLPYPMPPGATFTAADLADGPAMLELATGCDAVVHFGGISVERPFDETVGPNLIGLYNVYEAARRARARVVFASSNHTIGFYERASEIDIAAPTRPDGYYGLSKVYGEGMARLYWDKHGVETVNLRIGSCRATPIDARMLATWLSLSDLISLVDCALAAPEVGYATIWGVSANDAQDWWRDDDRHRISWQPKDNAASWADELAGVTGDPVAERYQGGAYCALHHDATTTTTDKI